MTERSAVADTRRLIAIGVAVSVSYVLAAKLGFRVAFVAEQVTTVWAPTGIGMAALLLWGRALWPAIWLGAFVANAGTDAPLWTAAAVATGNTLEAVAAAWTLRRVPRFDPTLRRIGDVVAFILIGAVLSTAVSATVGVTTLCASAVQSWSRFGDLWWDWWLGDALGALVVAPVILTTVRRTSWSRSDWVEAGLLVGGDRDCHPRRLRPGLRSDERESSARIRRLSVRDCRSGPSRTASDRVCRARGIGSHHLEHGPGCGPVWRVPGCIESLVLLQVFMGVLAGTGLLLAAAIAERETGKRRRAAASTVGEVLAAAHDLTNAAPAVLQAICENLEWQLGALWLVDEEGQRLRCFAVWSEPAPPTRTFAAVTRGMVFARAVGLPGRVWATGKRSGLKMWSTTPISPARQSRAPLACMARSLSRSASNETSSASSSASIAR